MSENKEVNEELLDEVTGGAKCIREAAFEKSAIDDAKKKIAAATKAGKAIKETGEKKVAAVNILPW